MIRPNKINDIELKMIPRPTTQRITPRYMGFRQYAKGPTVTNFWVGTTGVCVPLPTLKKSQIVQANKQIPEIEIGSPQ